jgi:hypothetical protein
MKALIACAALFAAAASAAPFVPAWRAADITDGGKVTFLADGSIACAAGNPLSGIVCTNDPPRMDYEFAMEGMKESGDDFFIALTLPVETNCCTVIIGGWGGGLCGISSINYMDASENQYSEGRTLEAGKWYTLRVRVTAHMLEVFLNDKFYTAEVPFAKSSVFSLRPGSEIGKTAPLGLATYRTAARWRNIRVTPVTAPVHSLPFDE